MPDEKKDVPGMNLPKLPPLPGMPAPGKAAAPSLPPMPSMPGLPTLPPFPGAVSPKPSVMPAAPKSFPPAAAPVPPVESPSRELERKVLELEKKLQDEREKVLRADLRSQEEKTYATKVEVAIKEVQDKLRRDRRDAEVEESKLKMEAKIQELETRLAQERETWVTTLKGQTRTREVQDKEIETHFAMRMQEMERRWLEEKGQWQRSILGKDEEIRNLKALADRLKGIELEVQKVSQEKKFLEERLLSQTQELNTLQGRARGMEDREREYFQVKAELMSAKDQVRGLQDKLEREVDSIRRNAKEREDRLLQDQERLQNEVQSAKERARHEAELDINKHKAESNMAQAALQRLKAVAAALERQLTTLKPQADEAVKAKKEVERINQHYKAEFLMLQRRWQEREKEIRKEADVMAQQNLETERIRLKLQFQDEFQGKVQKLREEMEKDAAQRIPPGHSGPPAPPNYR